MKHRGAIGASRNALRHIVVKLNQPAFKPLGRTQGQGDVAVTSRDQRDAVSDEHWNDADDELVDSIRVEKRGDDLAAAHQPNILACPFSKAIHEWAD